MEPDVESTPQSFHRKMASDLFNGVWSLLEKPDRNCAETDRMIHAAHASRFHWEFGGSPVNLGIGEWQCARVHAVVGHGDAAAYHGFRYLEIAEDYQLGPFHVGFAHEALARAFLLTDREKAMQHLQKARTAAMEISEEDERALLEKDLATVDVLLAEATDDKPREHGA